MFGSADLIEAGLRAEKSVNELLNSEGPFAARLTRITLAVDLQNAPYRICML